MKNQVKVATGAKLHQDKQGERLVVTGKLVLINTKTKNFKFGDLIRSTALHDGNAFGGKELHTVDASFMANNNPDYWDIVHPLIISETESVFDCTELHYTSDYNELHSHAHRNKTEECCVVLAWPENFSQKQLDAIGDKKMRVGDLVYVECVTETYDDEPPTYLVNLVNGHVKLFPVVKDTTVFITPDRQLLEDYRRRLVTITAEIKNRKLNDADKVRYNTKASCYRTIISELERSTVLNANGYIASSGSEQIFVFASDMTKVMDKLEEVNMLGDQHWKVAGIRVIL